ncbi:MAG: 1,4-alpha-glucan branching protein GlgB [Ignavibacteria bacterium]|nr:1,4-alpha-glucan branching protein GlgB [Ignavibacteria bacterium]
MSEEKNIKNIIQSVEEAAEKRKKEIEEKLHPENFKDEPIVNTGIKNPETPELEQNSETEKTESSGKVAESNEIDFNIKLAELEKPEKITLAGNINEKQTGIDLPKLIETEGKILLTEKKDIVKAIEKPIETITSNFHNEQEQSKLVTDFDVHLFNTGTYYKIYEKFGAQITIENGISGVRFTTWAPNAESISVIGEFNGWNDTNNYMNKVHDSGIWSVFISDLKQGDTYKFSIKSKVDGVQRRKIDPYAFRSEVRPKNACVVHDINNYEWNDSEWIANRAGNSFKETAMNIYELHLGSWKRNYNNKEFPNEWGYLSYGQLAQQIVDYVKQQGYTHIELMPVMEHPLDISWGYQVTHYYAPTSRFGEPQDFMYFVDYCHQNGIGVILDWVPAHFPADEHALAFYDGSQIYAYESWKKGFHKDWNTYVFDYARPQVKNFLIASALFWFEKYHADGLRVDAVASMLYLDYSRKQGEWEPNIHGGRENLEAVEFLKHLNDIVHKYCAGTVMIAEESTSWPGVSHSVNEGGLGFDMKWNMGWMNDILLYFSKEPVHRKYHQGKITFSLWYAFSENFVLPISHDEVVHGKHSLLEKMPGDTWQKFANLRLFFGFMTGHPGKKLNFMTSDIGQYNEWNSEASLEWNLLELVEINRQLNKFVKDLNHLYKSHPELYEVDFQSEGFQWIDFSDALSSILSFYRLSKDKKQMLLFVFNMTPIIRDNYIVGVPQTGFWKEVLNSDAEVYGGSGIGNFGGKHSEPVKSKQWENSITLTLPPLAVNVFELII